MPASASVLVVGPLELELALELELEHELELAANRACYIGGGLIKIPK